MGGDRALYVYGNLLAQKSLLSAEFRVFILHCIVTSIPKRLAKFVTSLLKAVVFPDLMQLELIRDSLTDHVFQFMCIA